MVFSQDEYDGSQFKAGSCTHVLSLSAVVAKQGEALLSALFHGRARLVVKANVVQEATGIRQSSRLLQLSIPGIDGAQRKKLQGGRRVLRDGESWGQPYKAPILLLCYATFITTIFAVSLEREIAYYCNSSPGRVHSH
ncbi:hypothetical protein V5799_024644 [Amblyomma americanum]|uniref:Uncharacterized protein n=1 Tax=Amblyomma americanum TaxID=6943 RepID=A0AAQ4EBX9_AMBAM